MPVYRTTASLTLFIEADSAYEAEHALWTELRNGVNVIAEPVQSTTPDCFVNVEGILVKIPYP